MPLAYVFALSKTIPDLCTARLDKEMSSTQGPKSTSKELLSIASDRWKLGLDDVENVKALSPSAQLNVLNISPLQT